MLQHRCIKEKYATPAPWTAFLLTLRSIKFPASEQQFTEKQMIKNKTKLK